MFPMRNLILHFKVVVFFHTCCIYFLFILQIYCEVIPKRHALSQANAELETATAKLLALQKKLAVSTMLFLPKSLSLKTAFSLSFLICMASFLLFL